MKAIKKLLLINWHSFWKEFVEFENINFLTGINASGKSTMIDAMQLLFLGDTTGHFFNKAANEKSTRTLKGYLYGEIGEDGDSGFKYLREGKRFTSYIACELYDDVKKSEFTLGVVFDCQADSTYEHKFFILNSGIPDNKFIVNNIPLSYKQLRNFFENNYKKGIFQVSGSNRDYQENLKGKLGGIKNKYFSLFKKAVSFSPITDIETFITEYICDVKSFVDISLMQDNIRAYKRLEYDANIVEKRIQALEEISLKYNSYYEEAQRLEIQSYIIKRAEHQEALDKFENLKAEFRQNNEEIITLSKEQEKYSSGIDELRKKRENLIADKINSDIYKKIEELEKEKEVIGKEITKLKEAVSKTQDNIKKYGNIWRKYTNKFYETNSRNIENNSLPDIYKEDLVNFSEISAKVVNYTEIFLHNDLESLYKISKDGFLDIKDTIEDFKREASRIEHSLSENYRELSKKCKELEEEIKNLDMGIKPYDGKLLELRKVISEELTKSYGRTIEVHILADLLEIKETQWRNAIEAYLYKEKFYLFVEPEYFASALKIYEKIKTDKNFYRPGIIDTENLNSSIPLKEPENLAEEVVTENKYAKLFINHMMGSLIKCRTEEKLREHKSSITNSCILYENYTLSELKPEEWKYPYIGMKSIEEQIKVKKDEIVKIKEKLSIYDKNIQIFKDISSMEIINSNEIDNIVKTIEESRNITDLEKRYGDILKELEGIDLTWLDQLDETIKEVDAEIERLVKYEKEAHENITRLKTINESINNEKIPGEIKNIESKREIINKNFTEDWIKDRGEPRFIKELEMRTSASEVYNNFYSQVARTKSQKESKKIELVQLRSDYNKDYKMSYDINLERNIHYDKELGDLKEVKLPEYKKQIQDTMEKALEQFREDFLAKIKSNIDTIKIQIDELNSALKESSFGTDNYHFNVKAKTEYKNYYDMITDEMLLDGFQLSSPVFQSKYKDSIDELFKQIVDVDPELNADQRAELERNIKKFTDYRTYLSFDLIVTDEEGRRQRLSKTLNKKSGGETQTPFYVSVLASFAQLYRINDRGDTGNTMRLIIFDEAFSKMDSDRIQESVKLLRRFNLQSILSAPPEKIGDIAPLVDRTLCVIREKDNSHVKLFDAKKFIEV